VADLSPAKRFLFVHHVDQIEVSNEYIIADALTDPD
jgi:hypothetical protein